MTNPPPELLESAHTRRPARRRRPELALWIFGAALIVLGIGAAALLSGILVQRESSSSFTDVVPVTVTLQVFELVTPGLFTGGLISFALAIFSRALDTNARRRDELVDKGTSSRTPTIDEPQPAGAAVPPARETAGTSPETVEPTDYSAFMRPAEDPGTAAE